MANEQTEESSTHQFPRRTARRPRSRPAPGTSTWRHPVLRPTCSFRPSCRSWEGKVLMNFFLGARLNSAFWNFQRKSFNFLELSAKLSQYSPRDARPKRSTPGLSRPCEVDAEFRVCRPRRCILCARRFSADSARFDTPALLRPKQDARALWRRKTKNMNARFCFGLFLVLINEKKSISVV